MHLISDYSATNFKIQFWLKLPCEVYHSRISAEVFLLLREIYNLLAFNVKTQLLFSA